MVASALQSLQAEAFECGGFVSKYLQTDMFEGCTLLANLFGFDEIADARLQPYVQAAEQQEAAAGPPQPQQRRRASSSSSSRGQKRARGRR